MTRSDLSEYVVKLLLDDPETSAILVTEDDENRIWLPRSQIEYEPAAKAGYITVVIPDWLAKEKGLI